MRKGRFSPEEIAQWLERRVPATVWHHSGVKAHVEEMRSEALKRAVTTERVSEAREALQEFLRWEHVYRALSDFLESEQRRSWRLRDHAVLDTVWGKWFHWTPERRAQELQAILADEGVWEIVDGPIYPEEKEVLSLISALKGKGPTVPPPLQKRAKTLPVIASIIALVIGAFLGGGIVFALHRAGGAPTTTPTVASFLPTETVSVGRVTTPVLPTIAPTHAPTPVPVSVYSAAPLAWIAPAFPKNTTPMFVIDDTRATLSPTKGWKKGITGLGNSHVYWDTPVLPGSKVTATWAMDILWPRDGLFQLLALDPASQGGGAELTYRVLADGSPVSPLAGTGKVKQRSTYEGQHADEWRAVGIYHLSKGARVVVQLDLSGFKGSPKRHVAGVDAIAWAALQEPTVQEYPPMQQVPGVVVYWADNQVAKLVPQGGWLPVLPSPENFGGAVRFHSMGMGKGYAEWELSRVLAGYYRLCVWIPPTDATMRWQVKVGKTAQWKFDNKNLPDPIKGDTVEFSGKDYKHWVCLGWLTVQEPTTVSIRLSGKGNLIADAVFLLAAQRAQTPTPTLSPTATPTPTTEATSAPSPTSTATPTRVPTPRVTSTPVPSPTPSS